MEFGFEKSIYWLTWLFGVFYSLFAFCQQVYDKNEILDPADFSAGWTFLNRKKDVSDHEWAVFTAAFKKYWMAIVLHVFLSQIILVNRIKVLPIFHTIYSLIWLVLIIGPYFTMLYTAYIGLMYTLHVGGRKSICYVLTISILFILNQERFFKFRTSVIPQKVEGHLIDVGCVWLAARCLSFSVDRISTGTYQEHTWKHIALIFSYCLYLPAVFTGPLLNYQEFVSYVTTAHESWTMARTSKSLRLLVHPFIGYLLLEFLLHYVYSASVQYYPELVFGFDTWSLCGLGYALPVMFYLKYFVFYSLVVAIAGAECIDFPPPPKCISHVHRQSHLWRTFDRGLYLWLLRYLYLPVINDKWTTFRKVTGVTLCFAFVCVWHGMDRAIFAWTMFNCFGILYEMFTKSALYPVFCGEHKNFLTANCQRRLQALFATPNFMLMCVSCIFFLSNWDIGSLTFARIFFGGAIPFLPAAFIMYCGCNVSMHIIESENDKNKKQQ